MRTARRPIRILAVNDYDFEHARSKIERGTPARHHLWGLDELSRDERFEVHQHPFSHWPSLNHLASGRTGDLDQQLRALLSSNYDILYAANYSVVMGLGLLRHLRLYRRKIVVAGFTLPPAGRLTTMMMSGFAHFVCLSSLQAEEMKAAYPRIGDRISFRLWGWDEKVQPATGYGNTGVILSAGKTMRDYRTYIDALQISGIRSTIICPSEYLGVDTSVVPSTCQLISGGQNWAVKDDEMSDLIRNCAAVAIPLKRQDRQPNGLSSLLEAMAHGKAIVMTRNPYIDIDIEKIGCGIWVDEGSVSGWAESMKWVTANPERTVEMGRRGRLELQRKYTIRHFAEHLAGCIVRASEGM